MNNDVQNDRIHGSRILHVTDCYDGGVSRAINDMVENAGHLDHMLVFHGDEEPPSGLFRHVVKVEGGPMARLRRFRKVVRGLDASMLHVHSSWAGGFLRMGRRPALPLIYQPHCYKFVDPSLSRLEASAYRVLERLLLPNTTVTVALSPAERLAATALGPTPVIDVPNVPSVPPGEVTDEGMTRRRLLMMGRLSPQKDPDYFLQIVREARRSCPELDAVWIGDGDEQMHEALTREGVRVTGWLEKRDVADMLSGGGVYVHSATYEGLPLAVLDAVQRGLPVLVRRTPSFQGIGGLRQFSSPSELAAEAVRLMGDVDAYRDAIEGGRPWLAQHTDEQQNRALRSLYEAASAG